MSAVENTRPAPAYTQEDLTCSITSELFKDPVELNCGSNIAAGTPKHVFDRQGIEDWRAREPSCPTCRAPIKPGYLKSRPDLKQAAAVFSQKQTTDAAAANPASPSESGTTLDSAISNVNIDQQFVIFASLEADRMRRKRYKRLQVLQGFLLLLMLFGISIGVYFSVVLAPLIISALMASGLTSEFALICGILASCALVMGAMSLVTFALPGLYKLFLALEDAHWVNYGWLLRRGKYLAPFLYWMGIALGIGGGVYLCVAAMPLLLDALVLSGLSYWLAVCIGVAAGIILVLTSIELVTAWPAFLAFLKECALRLEGRDPKWKLLQNMPALLGLLACLGMGIYLTVLTAPPLMMALSAYGLPLVTAALLTAVLSFALIAMVMKVASVLAIIAVNFFKCCYFCIRCYQVENEMRGLQIDLIERTHSKKINSIQAITFTLFPFLSFIIGLNTQPSLSKQELTARKSASLFDYARWEAAARAVMDCHAESPGPLENYDSSANISFGEGR